MPWPCTTCGEPGVRNLGTDGWCALHLAELLGRFDPLTFADNGVGLLCGVVRPEYGPGVADVACNACGATWAGVPGEACVWCHVRRERRAGWMDEDSRREVDRDDGRAA